ncbi:MAG TPA: SIS domain-containing protein [Solirubrobacteraceae bacterium]|nr:SIS domain-containing protein [Solirubrobacteraceae bacterium]
MTDTPGGLMAAEIAEQPAMLARILGDTRAVAAVRDRVRAARPRFVLIAARGTSDHAALYAKYLVEVRLGLPAGLVSPSAYTVQGARPDLRDVLFVAVSQSGRSPDLVDSQAVAHECGALTLAVTNAPESPLAQGAELSVDVAAGAERAVAATKTYTAELLALQLLLSGDDAERDAAALPEAAERTLELASEDRLATAAELCTAERLVVTGRGFSYPTAREAALKLMETSYVSAQAFSGADLLHGPMAMIDASVPTIAVVSPGRDGEAMAPVLERLAALGAPVLRVGAGGPGDADGGRDPGGPGGAGGPGDPPGAPTSAPDGPTLPIAADGLPEHLLPVLEILPLQRLALTLALRRGVDPDRPRGLSKVTQTL